MLARGGRLVISATNCAALGGGSLGTPHTAPMQDISFNLTLSAHITALLVFGLLLMLLDAFKQHRLLAPVAALGFVASAVLGMPGGPVHDVLGRTAFNDSLMVGGVAGLVHVFLCAIGLLALTFYGAHFKRMGNAVGEVYALSLLATIGMSILVSARDLTVMFVGLEIMSVTLYVMAALFKRDMRSTEAGFKYFLLGAFASGFLLYGIALLYGVSGSMHLPTIGKAIFTDDPAASIANNLLFWPAIALVMVGFLFKLAAFPFHSWTPDVYSGAPTPVAGFMATGSKIAAFVAFSFFVMNAMPTGLTSEVSQKSVTVLGIVALASMVFGNLVALRQSNIKRLLAYSGIAHTGYMLLGVAAGPEGYMNVIFYVVVYAVMTLGAFGILSMIEANGRNVDMNGLRGLGRDQPVLAALMAVFMLSMAGIPPLAGFMAKYIVFGSAIQAGIQTGQSFLVVLAVVGILSSVIGAFYYLNVIVAMYFRPRIESVTRPELNTPPGFDQPLIVERPAALPVVGALVLGTLLLVLGLYPGLVYDHVTALYAADGYLTQLLQR
jgi:NADH-quinone oxidoreductase subunit N